MREVFHVKIAGVHDLFFCSYFSGLVGIDLSGNFSEQVLTSVTKFWGFKYSAAYFDTNNWYQSFGSVWCHLVKNNEGKYKSYSDSEWF